MNKVLAGDILAAARLIRGIEDKTKDTVEELRSIYHHTGRAYVVGITGAPGVGKSTLLGSLIPIFRKRQMTVGVVAIDPTSPLTGGAILGDRIRMQSHSPDKDVFIRSLASRGWKGGLAEATVNTIHVMDAMGKDIIFVEPVGSGQGDVDITKVVDTSIVILVPGMGDEIQLMKAGVLETADIFVINKTDRDGAENLRIGLETMLEIKTRRPNEWRPSIILTEALFNKGTEKLVEEILKHREFLISSGELGKRRRARAKLELMMAIESYLKNYVDRMDKDYLEKLIDDLAQRKTDPHTAAVKIINLVRDD